MTYEEEHRLRLAAEDERDRLREELADTRDNLTKCRKRAAEQGNELIRLADPGATIEAQDDEIARLRDERDRLQKTCDAQLADVVKVHTENARLRESEAELHRIRQGLILDNDRLRKALKLRDEALERLEVIAKAGYPTRSVSYEMVRHERNAFKEEK